MTLWQGVILDKKFFLLKVEITKNYETITFLAILKYWITFGCLGIGHLWPERMIL